MLVVVQLGVVQLAQLFHLLSLELVNFLFMGFKDLISNGYSSLHKVLNGIVTAF